jgi:hypothetical protein
MDILTAVGFGSIGLVVVIAGNLIADAIEKRVDARKAAKRD